MDFKRKYSQVDQEMRKELLRIIESEQLSIKLASEKLGINYSTAKNIVRIFRKEKRMNKLPKRVNKALEEVLKAWKEPPKKISRFVAKKCQLFDDKHTEIDQNEKNETFEKKKVCEAGDGKTEVISVTNELYNDKPIIDFKVYTSSIMQNWKNRHVVYTAWVPMIPSIPSVPIFH